MVAKDAERMCGHGTGRNMEYAGEQLSGNLVHIGNHQQQTLRRSERCGEGTSLERAMYGSGSTTLGLHFLYHYCVTKKVLTALSGPFVHMLRHGR